MSRKTRRQHKLFPTNAEIQRLVEAEVSRRLALNALPPGATVRPLNQDALFAQMSAQQAPAKQGTTMFSPGAPLHPSPGLVLDEGPRTFTYPVGYNISSQPRSTETTSFETLRNLASLYDGIQLCEQVWLDTVAKLNLVIKPRPEIIAEQGQSASNTKYTDKIRKYTDILNYPDKYNGYDLKTWLRAAVRDQLQIDAVAIYIRKNKAGGVFSLELVDGTTVKPLIDPRGRRPQPPYPAYQQFYYGVPDGWYTSDEMIYLKETPRTESIYGLSRIERIILRVNQALRKQNKDLARFTEGNIPPAILQPPNDGSQWTPEQLIAYQTTWDALLAGNDQARSRIKVVEPGSVLDPIEEPDIFLDFDRFLLNVTTACYSMTMADLGFTESVNKSSGDSQENVFYRRAVQPLMDRYSQLFTQILRDYFAEQDLVVTWGGFEEAEDFNAMATSYVALVGSGIISPTVAAQQMKLPTSGADIPVFVLVPGQGITFLEDAANPEMRKVANDAKKAGYQQASKPPPPAPEPGQATDEPNGVGVPQEQQRDKKARQDEDQPKTDKEPLEKSDNPSFFVQVVDNDDDDTERAYNPGQARDARGRFASGGGSATSTSDATKPSNEQRLANLANLMGSRYPHCNFDFSGCDIEVAKRAATQVDTLFKEYPDVAKSVPYIGTGNPLKGYDPHFENTSAIAHVSQTYVGEVAYSPMFLNSEHLGNSQKLQETYDKCRESGFLATDSVEGTITHEFGHVLHFYLLQNGKSKSFTGYTGKDGEGTPAKAIDEYTANNRGSAGKISRYAKANDFESVAEGFASYHHNPNPPAYAKGLKSVVDKLLPNGRSSHWALAKPKRLTAAQRNQWNDFYNDHLSTV